MHELAQRRHGLARSRGDRGGCGGRRLAAAATRALQGRARLRNVVPGHVGAEHVDVHDEGRGCPPVVVAQVAAPDERDSQESAGPALGGGSFGGRRHRGHAAERASTLRPGRFGIGSSTSVRRRGGPVVGRVEGRVQFIE